MTGTPYYLSVVGRSFAYAFALSPWSSRAMRGRTRTEHQWHC